MTSHTHLVSSQNAVHHSHLKGAKATPPKNASPQTKQVAEDAPQTEEKDTVLVKVYPQDPYVGEAEAMKVDKDLVGDDLSNSRVKSRDTRPLVKADADGNYLPAEGTSEISQVNAHMSTTLTLQTLEKYRGGTIPWGFGRDQLSVIAHKQEGANAYYSRWERSTNYFHFESSGLDTTVKTSNSGDVASHETGHAVLDGIRPGYLGGWDTETGAFHEAFGDCVAMLQSLEYAGNRQDIIDQTGGDLQQHNNLSSLAEEFGAAIKRDRNDDPSDDNNTWLRTAINDFTYVPPSEVPPGRGSDNELGREIHSYSRLFSATFYDALDAVFQQVRKESEGKEGFNLAQGLKETADVMGQVFMRSIDLTSSSEARFKEVTANMLKAEQQLFGGKYGEAMKQAFVDRKMLDEHSLAQAPTPELDLGSPLLLPKNDAQAIELLYHHEEALKFNPEEHNKLKVDSLFKNDKGETFIAYSYAENLVVHSEDPSLNGKVTDIFGGLTLAFDAQGKLTNYVHSPINDEKRDRCQDGIALMHKTDSIKMGDGIFNSFENNTKLYKGYIEGNTLVKVPVTTCPSGHIHGAQEVQESHGHNHDHGHDHHDCDGHHDHAHHPIKLGVDPGNGIISRGIFK